MNMLLYILLCGFQISFFIFFLEEFIKLNFFCYVDCEGVIKALRKSEDARLISGIWRPLFAISFVLSNSVFVQN